jgi:hypothetical protein
MDMFAVRMSCTTVMSEIVFQVFDVMSGRVLLATRDPGKAVRVASELNSGAERVAIF